MVSIHSWLGTAVATLCPAMVIKESPRTHWWGAYLSNDLVVCVRRESVVQTKVDGSSVGVQIRRKEETRLRYASRPVVYILG
jgi:hypothetical protein